jgi:hypothetical protein
MKKLIFLILFNIILFSAFGQNKTVVRADKVRANKELQADVMLTIDNDTVYAIQSDTTGMYAVNGRYFLCTVKTLQDYVAAHSGGGTPTSQPLIYNTLGAKVYYGGNIDGSYDVYVIDTTGGDSTVTAIFDLNTNNLEGLAEISTFYNSIQNRFRINQNIFSFDVNFDTIIKFTPNKIKAFVPFLTDQITIGYANPVTIDNSQMLFPTTYEFNGNHLNMNFNNLNASISDVVFDIADSFAVGSSTNDLFVIKADSIKADSFNLAVKSISTNKIIIDSIEIDTAYYIQDIIFPYDKFIGWYEAAGNDTIGGSSFGDTINIVTRYKWVPLRIEHNTWTNYKAVTFTYDNDTIEYEGAADTLYFETTINLLGSTNIAEIRWFNITDNVPIPGKIATGMTGTFMIGTFQSHDFGADKNDRYILQIRNESSNTDFYLYNGYIKITE